MGRLQLSRFDKLSVTLCFKHAILTLHPEPEPAPDLIGGRMDIPTIHNSPLTSN